MMIPTVFNFILRVFVKDSAVQPHPELEDQAPHCPGLWTKDYEIACEGVSSEETLFALIQDALRIAAEVRGGEDICLHIEFRAGEFPLQIPPSLLLEAAQAGCALEFWADAEDDE